MALNLPEVSCNEFPLSIEGIQNLYGGNLKLIILMVASGFINFV